MGITQNIGASSLIRPGVIDNAAARPASPYEGQAVYQKDTDAVLVWNGTAWYPNWNQAWGVVSLTESTSQSASITTTQATQLTSASFTAVANRRYKISYYEPYVQSGATPPQYMTPRIRLTDLNGTVLAVTDVFPTGTSTTQIILLQAYVTLSAGSTVVVATMTAATQSFICYGAATTRRQLIVEDVGPA